MQVIARSRLACLLALAFAGTCPAAPGSPPTASCVAFNAVQGTPITAVTMVGSGGASGSYTYVATGLPDGLSLDKTSGKISGTPTAAGTFSYTVTVTDSAGNPGKVNCSATVYAPVTVASVTINAVQGVAIKAVSLVASGGAGGTYTYAVPQGLPPGLAIDPTKGIIAGTPAASGNFPFTVTVTDSAGNAGTATCSVIVVAPPTAACVAINAVQANAITPVRMIGTGGVAGGLLLTTPGLPPGLTMAIDGTISGTPTVSGAFPFTVTVADKANNTGTVNCSLTVYPQPTAACPVISAVRGVPITPVILVGTGGTGGPYKFSAAMGLPDGVQISDDGKTISGTPTVSGTFALTTVTVADFVGNVGTVNCSVGPYTVSPDTVVPGKTYTMVVHAGDCSLGGVTVLPSGSGLTLTQIGAGQDQTCSWTGTLTVAQDADFSDAQIVLQWPRRSSASVPIHIVAKAPGAIPPGLRPSVDVAWKVVSRRISSDNYGARLTKLYFPVEIVIGNNSGYDLQLTAVEFDLKDKNGCESGTVAGPAGLCAPSDSYFVVRSSLEREQSIGFRNTTVNIVKAIGPILTGSAVFFDGASLAAAHHKAVFQGIAGVFSGAFEAGLELVAPDQTVRQLINLDNHSLRDGIIIANNTQIRSIVFVDRELISRSLRNLVKGPASQLEAEKVGASIGMWSGMRKKDYDPQAVMAALGSLHLVGRSIAYLNRVSVISNAPGPAPTVTGATGNSATAGGSPVTLTLTGDSLSGATLTSPDPKLVITNPTVGDGGKSFTATIDPKNATAQTYQLTLSTASGSIAVQFVVNAPPPSITNTAGASAIAGGSPATLTLTGVSLAGATLSSPDSSLLITSQKASADGTSFTATIDPQKATAKTYPLTLTVGTVTLTVQFKVTTS